MINFAEIVTQVGRKLFGCEPDEVTPDYMRFGTIKIKPAKFFGTFEDGPYSRGTILDLIRLKLCREPISWLRAENLIDASNEQEVLRYLTDGGEQSAEAVQARERLASTAVELVDMKDVKLKNVKWLWEGNLARGCVGAMSGVPGIGKSQLQISLIAHVTTGRDWPDGSPGCEPGYVIMLTAEDGLAQAVKPRLLAAEANIDKVKVLHKVIREDKQRHKFLLKEDLELMRRVIHKIRNESGDVAMITIDPITSYMGGEVNSHRTTDVRDQLDPMNDFAEAENIAIHCVTHPAKQAGSRAIDYFIGSQAFIAAPRIAHVCVEEIQLDEDGEPERDETNQLIKTGRVLFTNPKNNIHVRMPTWAFELSNVIVGQDEDTHENVSAPYVVWKETVNVSPDQAVSAGATTPRSKGPNVPRFLKKVLTPGPMKQAQLIELAEAEGISLDQMKRAKAEANVSSKKIGFGEGA